MKLFLASEVKNPETTKKLDEYVGGLKGKKIVYVPTATNGEGWGSWKDGDSWKLAQSLDAQVTLIQLEDYFHSDVTEKFKNQDIIWFAGGYCGYLMYWIRRTKLDKALPSLLENGTVYVGSSAGAMITGKSLDIAEWYLPDAEYGAGILPGLSLVDFNIFPHFEDEYLDEIKKNYKGNALYLLKNGEELIVEDNKITFIGDERIIKGA